MTCRDIFYYLDLIKHHFSLLNYYSIHLVRHMFINFQAKKILLNQISSDAITRSRKKKKKRYMLKIEQRFRITYFRCFNQTSQQDVDYVLRFRLILSNLSIHEYYKSNKSNSHPYIINLYIDSFIIY